MTLASQIASDLLDIKAVYLKPEEPFTWASGIKSPIYTDNRITLSYPETRTLIENGFVKKIKEEFPEVEVIAGTATAGIPHGAIIADKMNLPFAYIRSKPKDHGAGNQIEGRVVKGEKMVVVEDLISLVGQYLMLSLLQSVKGLMLLVLWLSSLTNCQKLRKTSQKLV